MADAIDLFSVISTCTSCHMVLGPHERHHPVETNGGTRLEESNLIVGLITGYHHRYIVNWPQKHKGSDSVAGL